MCNESISTNKRGFHAKLLPLHKFTAPLLAVSISIPLPLPIVFALQWREGSHSLLPSSSSPSALSLSSSSPVAAPTAVSSRPRRTRRPRICCSPMGSPPAPPRSPKPSSSLAFRGCLLRGSASRRTGSSRAPPPWSETCSSSSPTGSWCTRRRRTSPRGASSCWRLWALGSSAGCSSPSLGLFPTPC